MGDWARTTRECRYEQLAPDMRAAFEKYCALYNLGPLGAQSTLCIETTSKKVKKGLFGGAAKDVVVAALLAPGWLLWAIRGDSPQPVVMSARLADITAQDYARTPLMKMVPDSGVEVTGSFTDVAERGSAFIGLGDEPAANAFKEQLLKAVQEAK